MSWLFLTPSSRSFHSLELFFFCFSLRFSVFFSKEVSSRIRSPCARLRALSQASFSAMSAFLLSSRLLRRDCFFCAARSAVRGSDGPLGLVFGSMIASRLAEACWPSTKLTRPKEKLLAGDAGVLRGEPGDRTGEPERSGEPRAKVSLRFCCSCSLAFWRNSFLWAFRCSTF